MPNPFHPYHPIIYVRGFAATAGAIDEAVADPYMGFNVGSTKSRQLWDGKVRQFFFESPLVRLKDEVVHRRGPAGPERTPRRYDDTFVNGEDLTAPHPDDPTRPLRDDIVLPYQSLVVYRYYDEASPVFGSGQTPPIERFATGLGDLILRLRTLVCKTGEHPITGEPIDNGVTPETFRVYLVAHSMGGLICRAFVQNPALHPRPDARTAVDKIFTYATPHNGIDVRVIQNVPGFRVFGDSQNFNREYMARYLGLPGDARNVADLGAFPAERVFNFVGTNPADYTVMNGLSSWAVGEHSDGLVQMDNAVTHGADGDSPRAYAHRSHSGHFGIVNSEEGYQNLTRFLFGALRVDGHLDVTDLSLPAEVQRAYDNGKMVRASYQFEVAAAVRGCQWQLHRRTVRERSAIFRTYDELFPGLPGFRRPNFARSPHLFSIFLDPSKTVPGLPAESVSFSFDLAVLVPDYVVGGIPLMRQHYEGGYLYREMILVEARRDLATGRWIITHGRQSDTPNQAPHPVETEAVDGGVRFHIPVVSGTTPGVTGRLRLFARPWNQ